MKTFAVATQNRNNNKLRLHIKRAIAYHLVLEDIFRDYFGISYNDAMDEIFSEFSKRGVEVIIDEVVRGPQ